MGLAEVVQQLPPQAGLPLAVGGHLLQPPLVLGPEGLRLLRGEIGVLSPLLEEDPGGDHIPRAEEEDAVRRLPVPPGPAGLLVIGLQAFGHVVVDHVADVGLVNAHAEGVGGHHHRLAVKLEVLLVLPALVLGQAGVVPGGGDALAAEKGAHLLHPRPGGAVDDAALPPALLHQVQEDGALLLRPEDVEEEVGPVKAGDHRHRVLEAQLGDDVLLDRRRVAVR